MGCSDETSQTCLQAWPQMSTSDAKADVLCCLDETDGGGLTSEPISHSARIRSILEQGDL